MFDVDVLRNQLLIEEREIYENNFINIDDIIKSGEMDYYACPKYQEYYLDDFEFNEFIAKELSVEFELEYYNIQLRDEQLIEQREIYELENCLQIDDSAEYDPFESQIDSYVKWYYEGYGDYEYRYVEEFYFEDQYSDYVSDDDIFDGFDECDYPEGPDENINGVKCPYDFFDVLDDYFDCPEPDYFIEDMFYEFYAREERHMQKLIDQHIEEEKKFFGFITD